MFKMDADMHEKIRNAEVKLEKKKSD